METGKGVETDRDRPEGVYLRWETYPPQVLIPSERNNLLVIERVNGDWSVDRLLCTRDEARVILRFLGAVPELEQSQA